MMSIGRFCSLVFPAFVVLSILRRERSSAAMESSFVGVKGYEKNRLKPVCRPEWDRGGHPRHDEPIKYLLRPICQLD
jgi:hypothetical protein